MYSRILVVFTSRSVWKQVCCSVLTPFFSDSAKQKIADEKAVKRAEQEMEKIEEQMEASVVI